MSDTRRAALHFLLQHQSKRLAQIDALVSDYAHLPGRYLGSIARKKGKTDLHFYRKPLPITTSTLFYMSYSKVTRMCEIYPVHHICHRLMIHLVTLASSISKTLTLFE